MCKGWRSLVRSGMDGAAVKKATDLGSVDGGDNSVLRCWPVGSEGGRLLLGGLVEGGVDGERRGKKMLLRGSLRC